MAFPTIGATNNSDTNNNTSHIVSMPAGIVAGHKLVAFFVCDGSVTVNTPSGWTKSVDRLEDSGTNDVRLAIYTKTAEGSDTLTVTTSGVSDSAHVALRVVTNGNFDLTVADGGSDSSPNPPSHTPSEGSADYLWIAVAAANNVDVSSYPASYGSNQVTNSSQDVFIAVATRNNAAASEDPGTFSISGNSKWITATIAYYPNLPTVVSMPILTTNTTFLTPAINFPAQASLPLITSEHTLYTPSTTASNKTNWINESKPSTTWSNEQEL